MPWAVPESEELIRVRSLPQRVWEDDPDLPRLTELLSLRVLTRSGVKKGLRLRDIQAVALRELHDYNRLMAPVPVGQGKTLITMLAGEIIGAKRPMLIVPGGLVKKTQREYLEYQLDWKVSPNLIIVSSSALSRVTGLELLTKANPDLVLVDEAHEFKNRTSARTKRLARFMKEHPDTVFVPLSGTFTVRDPNEYAHLAAWSMKEASPLPTKLKALELWRFAIAEKIQDHMRCKPGALLSLGPKTEGSELEQARAAYYHRMVRIPGVVAASGDGIGVPLEIRLVDPGLSEPIKEELRKMRTTWETPDGHAFDTAFELWRHVRTLACGFWQVWDPPAPVHWRTARKEWATACQYILAHNRRNIDSPLAAVNAIDQDLYPDAKPALAKWRSVKDDFVPNPTDFWADPHMVNWASEWLHKDKNKRGLVWTDHTAFGKKLSEIAKIPYFGPKGLDKTGAYVEDHDGPAIVSVQANMTGRNLQHKWDRNLIVSAVPKADRLEQLLGRTHRPGQLADTVQVEWVCSALEHFKGVCSARDEAAYMRKSPNEPNKLLDATWDIPQDIKHGLV